jgi:signal transduction histidine kinase
VVQDLAERARMPSPVRSLRSLLPGSPRRALAEVAVVAVAAGIDLVAWSGDSGLRGGGSLPLVVVPLATLLVYPTLLWRERAPVIVFAISWVYALSGLLLPRYLPIAALLVALHAVAAHRPLRVSAAAGIACLAPFLLDAANAADYSGGDAGPFPLLTALWILGVLGVCAWLLGRRAWLATRRRQLDREAHEAAVAHTIRAERLSLARDLHDTIANAVTAMLLQAAGARALAEHRPQDVTRTLTTIEHTGTAAMEELRRLLLVLREPAADGQTPVDAAPGLRDLDALVGAARGAGRTVTVETSPTALDRGVDVVAYRIVQEGLANAAKHAPDAPVSVDVSSEGADVVVTVGNAAPGPPRRAPRSTGLGLIGLAERVSLVGGTLDAGRDGDRFVLTARLPGGSPLTVGDVAGVNRAVDTVRR